MTTIYVGDVGVQIRLDTHQTLTYATKMEIHAVKPDGTDVVWTATQYGTTQSITYTTVNGDFDLPGDYILRSYVEWSTGSTHTGSPVELHVGDTDLTGLITMFRVLYRYITVIVMPYENFAIYHAMAVAEHAQNLVTYGSPSLAVVQTNTAICHLIADYFERGNPDWNYSSQSISPGITFSRSQKNGTIKTAPRQAYEDLMDGIVAATTAAAKPFFHYVPPVFTKKIMDIEPEENEPLTHITE